MRRQTKREEPRQRERRGLVWTGCCLLLTALLAALAAGGTAGSGNRADGSYERLRVKLVASYPHDATAYTQGLVWHQGALYESTGSYGASSVRRYALPSGEIEREHALPPDYFGEGLAVVGELLVQLTWQQGVALLYRGGDLVEVGRRSYVGEGWGLCYDGESLIMSDGSHVLTFMDPGTLAVRRRLHVSRQGAPLDRLNELEWAAGQLYANVYQTDSIARIDPRSGQVTAMIDAVGLLAAEERAAAEVLNGIAYRPETETFLLTGKYWPRLFEVVFVPAG